MKRRALVEGGGRLSARLPYQDVAHTSFEVSGHALAVALVLAAMQGEVGVAGLSEQAVGGWVFQPAGFRLTWVVLKESGCFRLVGLPASGAAKESQHGWDGSCDSCHGPCHVNSS